MRGRAWPTSTARCCCCRAARTTWSTRSRATSSRQRVGGPGRAGLARGQLPRGHPGQRRPARSRPRVVGLRRPRVFGEAGCLMATPARLTREDVAHVAAPGPPRPDRGGAGPVHRAAGRGARPRRRRGLPRPGRGGAHRPRPGRHQRAASRRAPARASTGTRCWPRPRRSRTTASGCPGSWGRRRDRPAPGARDRPPWSGPAS